MRLLDTAGGGGALAGGLGGELLAGSLATSGLAGSLLGTSHDDCCEGVSADEKIKTMMLGGAEGSVVQKGKIRRSGRRGRTFNS